MSSLKFRVWSTRESKWMFGYEYPNLGGFSLVGETILLGEFGRYPLKRYFEDFIIMQSTGLKDKNSKEIYEGDICKQPYLSDDIQIGIIEYHNAEFCFLSKEDPSKKVVGYSLIDAPNLEIIGNIHETPELLP